MVRVIRSKELLSSVRKDRRSYPFQKQSPTFRTARRNPLKKRDVIRAKKKIHPLLELVQKKIIQPSA